MTAVKMQKGDLVTHVYNDAETIADAKKKGFRLVGTEPAEPVAENAGETPDGEAPKRGGKG